MGNLGKAFKIVAGVVTIMVVHCAYGDATLTTLVSFDGSNGGHPWATLVQGQDGNFYGTTEQYGGNGSGTIFQMRPGGQLTTLHFFTGGSDGAHPKASLVQDADGNFYGTASDGGNGPGASYGGDGVIFKITPAGNFTTLASFNGTNGSRPWAAPMVIGQDGFLYGTTAFGGPTNVFFWGFGTVFRMAPSGALTTLHLFDYSLGDSPYGGLVEGSDGSFYGTTYSGGPSYGGTVFKITPDGNFKSLAAFSYLATNGFGPFSALLQGKDGNFYGTTTQGGASAGDPQSVNGSGFGTIFRMTPDGALTTLFSFNATNGAYPYAALVQDDKGFFYGTTASGGVYTNQLFGNSGYPGYGTIFRFAMNGTLTTLVSFDSTNGAQPFAGLTRSDDGSFYGTTIRGGTYGLGTVYRLDVPAPPSSSPTITCLDPTAVECGQSILLKTLISDPDGSALTAVWTINGVPVQTNTIPAAQPPQTNAISLLADLPLGTNHVAISVSDSETNTAACATTVLVTDTTRPEILFAAAQPPVLWPPNQQMIEVKLRAAVEDACSSTSWKITRVQSNEPPDRRGDGTTEPDWVITGDRTLKLRAERSGKGNGRVYAITLRAIDALGNQSETKIVRVSVPKNSGKAP